MERKCRLTVIGIWICLVLPLIVSEAKAQIRISKSSLTIEEGGKGFYKLHLDAPPSSEITLDITTTNSDVRVKPKSLTFTLDDWGKARKITVEAIRDADAEDDRAIISHSVRTASNRRRVSASLQAATAIAPSSLTVIVLDRYVPSHEVNISPSSGLSIRKGGSGNYSVSLIEKPDASVTVWASSDRSDVRVSPSSLKFYVGTWSSTRSFTVSVDADAASSSATISHSATSEDINYQGLTIDSLPVTVLQPPAGITQPPSRTKVLVGQTKTYYSPGLRSQPTDTVTINASSQAAGNATVTGSKSFGTGNWSTAQDFKMTGRSVGAATITYDVDSSDSRYDGYRLSSTSVTVEATTITCRADDVNIQLGGSSTLSWDSTNANSVTIDQGVGSVPLDSPQEGKTVTPPQPGAAETSKTTTYRFTAAGDGDPGACSVTITVWRPPSVDRFSADLTTLRRQQTTRLSWATSHASSTTIDQGVGSVPVDSSGQGRSVSPPQPSTAETSRSTSYTLTASNPGYTGADAASATVSVTVWNRPSVDSFTASPSTIDEGEDSGLKWTTTHATGVSIDQGVGPAAVDDETGTTKVSPHQDTIYTLAASNPAYSGTQAVTDTIRVTVLPATVLQPPAGITQPPSHTKVLVGQTKTYYSPALRNQPTGTVAINASSQAAGNATVTGSKSFGTGNWSTAQDFKMTGRSVGAATITYDVDSSDSRYDGYRLSSTSVTVEATTITCRADDTNIQLGGSSTLSWDSTNANSVTIDPGVGSVPLDSPQEGKTVTPPQPGAAETSKTTTYRFTAAGDGDPGACSVTITVWRPPGVDSFSADLTTLRKQQTTRLSWATGHASSTTIDQGVGSVPIDSSEEVRSVSPPQPSTAETSRSTSYTLTASNPGYTGADAASAAVSVTVWNRPSVDSFTASPSTIDEGEDSGLKWTTTHASGVSIDQGVGPVAVDDETGTTKVSPHQDTTYTLTASNPAYSGTRAVTDTVRVTVRRPTSSPGLSVSPTTLNITEGDTGKTYNVRLRTQPSRDVTVTVEVESGGDSRVQKNTSSLTFTTADWNRNQAVQVFAEEKSGTATGQARIANTPPSSYGGSAVDVTVNVADDDTDGCKATVMPTRLTIDEGENDGGYYDVVLAASPAASVTITLDLTGDPSLSADRSALTFTSGNWNTSQRVTIEAREDADYSDGRATIGHTASSTDEGCSGMSISSVYVNIRDDEPPPLPRITLSSDEAGVSEPDGTAMVTAAVAIGEEPAGDLTINLTHSGQATNGTDYTVATLTIGSGETSGNAELSVIDDKFAEGTEEIRLIANADGYRDSAPLSMNLTDDDSVGVTVTPAILTIPEGSRLAYRVMLTSRPSHNVTVTVSHRGDGDVSIDDQELTFTASDWETVQAVTVSAAQDEDARDDTAALSHSVASTDADYNGIMVSEVEVTVTDDEMAGVSIAPAELIIAEGGSDSYEVVLTSKPSHDVTVTISRSGDGDVSIDDQELTFTGSDWDQEKTVSVMAAHDDDAIDDTATFSHSVASTDTDYNGISVSEVEVTVTDDEMAGVSIAPAELTIAEGDSDSYEVVLTSKPSHEVTVTITHSGDGDIGMDHQELTFTDSDWETAQTVTVSAAQDDDARDDVATLSHSVASTDTDYNGIGVSEVEVTATDDETAGVSIRPEELTIAEGGSDSYRVVLTSKPSHEVTVTINHGGDNDIDSDPDRLTFSPSNWNQEKTVTVTSAQDDDARDDTATLSHTVSSTDGDYNGITVPEVDVTATDDETAGVSILPEELTIAEGGSDSYRVFLTSQPAHDVTVTISYSGDQNVSIDDQELTFTGSDWETAQAVTVSADQDEDARDDTATLSHSVASTDADYNGIGVSEVEVTATDDETAGVSILPEELTIAEGGSDTYQVVLTSQPTHEVTVTITHSGDGDIGMDHQELTFTDSDWETAQTVTVSAAQDDDARDDTATLSHSVASTDGDYNGVTVSVVEVTVTDDETAGVSIRPEELAIAEGGSDSYRVFLTSQPAHDVTVTISYSGDQDVSIDDQELTFTGSDWETPQAVTVSADQDEDARDDAATLSHSVASTDGDYNGVTVSVVEVTVTDDETASVSILPEELTIAEGGSDSYRVFLTSQPDHDVTVTISYSGDQDVSIDDQELTFTGSDWETPQAVTVSADQDEDARDDAATLSHSVASTDGDYNGITVPEVDVTATDDETAGVSITPRQLTIAEGGSDSYEVVLTSQPAHDVTVTITHSGDGDIGNDHQELTFTGSDWETPQTVTVSADQDDDARDDTATLSHSVASTDGDYNGIGVSEVEVTATDDETAGVSILPEELTIAEGGSDSYRVVLTSKPSHEVTVTINHGGDNDIDSDPDRLTFSPSNWNQEKTVTVTSAQDDDARDDTATLSHSVASTDGDYNGIGVSEVEVTATDDETAGVSILPEELTIAEGGSDTYQVVLTSKPAHDVIVTITHNGDADIDSDPHRLNFLSSDWGTVQTVMVTSSQDADAIDDTAALSHAVASTDEDYNGIAVPEVVVAVTDDETAGVSITPTKLTIAEGGSDAYQVVLTSQPAHDVTVTITHSGDGDISINDQELTFTDSDWETAQTVAVAAAQDGDARDDTATLSHSVASTDGDYNGVTVSAVDVTVRDDETAGVSIRPEELTIAEGGSDSYQVVLTSKPSHEVTVTITHRGDADIDSAPDRLTFSSSDWSQEKTVTVRAAQDDDARDDTATLSHTVSSTDGDYNGITVSKVAVAVTDDETAGVSITPTKLTIAEGGSDSYEVVLTSQPTHDVTVTVIYSGDPDIGIDNRELTFTDSDWETAQAVTVSAAQDDDARDDTATLSHSVASTDRDYNGIGVSEVEVAVTDDETAGVSIRPEELTIAEGASDSYQVVLTSQPSHEVTVTITHSGDGDISIGDQELTFTDSDWGMAKTVSVSSSQDGDAIDDTATLGHSMASADTDYNGIAVPEVAVTVTDDETAGVKVAPTRLAIPEDASTTYTVVLTSRPSRPVVVALSHSGDPDISANLAQVSFEPSEWDNPSTVTVQASRDPDAVDDTATLRHSASSSDSTYDGAPVDPVRITVGDLDSVGVNITPLNLTIDEGASRTYTVVLASKPSQDVVVEVDRTGDEDVVPQPDSLTFTGSNWQDPQAVTVQALQDPDAVDDTATLLHSTSSSDAAYGGLTVSDVSVSVIDDDTTGVNVSPLELAVLEGTSETCTVALASKPSAEVHISLNSNNNDVSPSPAFLTFSPTTWSTAQEVMVPVAQDEDATDEVATLTFSATSPDPAFHGISVSAVSVDINDDDNAGVKVVPNPHMSVPEGESATYTIVLLSQPLATVAVAISSSNPPMLTAAFDEVTFTQDNWSVAQTVAFDTFHDDNTLDENEVLSHSAVSLDPNYKGISVTPLLVTITDRTAEKLTRTLPVLLSAMSGALAESIQTAVESRFERRRQMQRMKQDQGWWMPSYYQDRSRLSPEFNPSGGPETEPILSRASFGLPLAGNAFGGTHWRPVLWGHGDFQHFSGTSSLVDFRGRLSATHVGMDLLSNRHVLTGLSFARSWGAMGYSDDREGRLAASFNTFHPYLYWQPHRRLSLWGIGGMGRGSVDLRDPRLAHVFNSEFRMWAGGLRSVLTKPGKNELGFRLDGFMSNIAIDPLEQIREVSGRASRARAMLETVHQRGGRKRSFSLKGEIGGRLDRGEAVHGAAMEAGLRLGFIDTPTGLDLSLQGRMLLFHDGGYRDWGAGLQASWDPGNKRRGLRMSAASSHGQNGRAGATLWDDSYAYAFGQGRSLPGNPVPLNRIGSEAAYGMEVLRGRGLLTPFSRLRWTGHGKELSVGSEFGLQPRSPDTNPLNMELEGIRGKSSRGPNMGVRIRMSIPF